MCQIATAINTKWSKRINSCCEEKHFVRYGWITDMHYFEWPWDPSKAFFLENIERSLYLLIKSLEICHMASLVEIVLNQSWWTNESLWVTYTWLVEGLSYRLVCNRKCSFASYHLMISKIIQNHIPSLH